MGRNLIQKFSLQELSEICHCVPCTCLSRLYIFLLPLGLNCHTAIVFSCSFLIQILG